MSKSGEKRDASALVAESGQPIQRKTAPCEERLEQARVVRHYVAGHSCDLNNEQTWLAFLGTTRTNAQLHKELQRQAAMTGQQQQFTMYAKAPAPDLPPGANGQPAYDWLPMKSWAHDELPAGRLAVRVVSRGGSPLDQVLDAIGEVTSAVAGLPQA